MDGLGVHYFQRTSFQIISLVLKGSKHVTSQLRSGGCNAAGLRRRGKQQNNYSGWWFGTFFIFPYIGTNNPN